MAHNFTSHPLETIILRRPTTAERRSRLSLPLRILTSPKTTFALAATAFAPLRVGRALLSVGKLLVPKTLGQALLIPSGAVLLKESATARKVGRGILRGDPGKFAAGLIEKAPKKIKETAAKTGIGGLVAAGIAGLGIGAIATGKGKDIVSNVGAIVAKIPKPSFPKKKETAQQPPIGLLPAPPSITPTTQPLGAVKQPVTPPVPVEKKAQPMKITNTFNPTIDIRFSKSKRFINQQINVRR